MTDFPNRVIEILRSCPNGLTTKDIAERLGTTTVSLSSRLSKLAAYGILVRFVARWPATVPEARFTKGELNRLPADSTAFPSDPVELAPQASTFTRFPAENFRGLCAFVLGWHTYFAAGRHKWCMCVINDYGCLESINTNKMRQGWVPRLIQA